MKEIKETKTAREFITKMYMHAEIMLDNDANSNEDRANFFYDRFNFKLNDECAKQDFYNIMLIKKHYYHIMSALLDGTELF